MCVGPTFVHVIGVIIALAIGLENGQFVDGDQDGIL
jgi:hypothetical protein